MSREELHSKLVETRDRIVTHSRALEGTLELSYGAGKWSIRQMLAHLADVEMINAWRLLRALAEPGRPIEDFDEELWSKNLAYDKRPGSVSGDLFFGSRNIVIHYFATMPDEKLDGTSIHPEKGPMSGWQWVQLIHDHDAHHLSQLDAARDGIIWKRPEPTADSWKYLGHKASE